MFTRITNYFNKKEIDKLTLQAKQEFEAGHTSSLSDTLNKLDKKIVNKDAITDFGDDYEGIVTNLLGTYKAVLNSITGYSISKQIMTSLWDIDCKYQSELWNIKNPLVLSNDILEVYGIIARNTDDPKLLSNASFNISRMPDNNNLTGKLNDKQYSKFVTRTLGVQEFIIINVEEQDQLESIAANVVYNVADFDVAYNLGENFPEQADMALNILMDRRNRYKGSDDKFHVIDQFISGLVKEEEFLPFVDAKVLNEYGLLSLKGSGKNLKRNLEIMKTFLSNKPQAVVAGYKGNITKQLAVRYDFDINTMSSIRDISDTEMKNVSDKLEDIRGLKKTYLELK